VAATLNPKLTPTPIAMSVNMFQCRFLIEVHPR
jgi:hypothetical protein